MLIQLIDGAVWFVKQVRLVSESMELWLFWR